MSLRRQPARPRSARVAPSYPRALGLLALGMAAAACSNTVYVNGGDAGAGGTVTSPSPSGGMPEPWGGSPGVAGQGGCGEAGAPQGGAGAGGYGWGGGLDGDMPEPFGGSGGAATSTGGTGGFYE